MSGMVGAMAAPTAPRSRRARAAAPPPSARRAPSRYQGFPTHWRSGWRSGRVAAALARAPVVAAAGSTSPAPDGRPRHRVLAPRPGSEIVTAAVSDPSTVTVEDEFHRRSSELGRTKKKKKGGRASRRRAQQGPPQVFSPGRRSAGVAPRQAPRSPPPIPSPDAISSDDAGAPRGLPRRRTCVCTRPWWTAAVSTTRSSFCARSATRGSTPSARASPTRTSSDSARAAERRSPWPSSLSLSWTPRRAPLQHAPLGVRARGDSAIRIRRLRDDVRRGRRARLPGLHHPDLACAKAGELEKAFETFRRMEMDGVSPGVVTYGALMDALSRRVLELTKADRRARAGESCGKSPTTPRASRRRFPAPERWVDCFVGVSRFARRWTTRGSRPTRAF